MNWWLSHMIGLGVFQIYEFCPTSCEWKRYVIFHLCQHNENIFHWVWMLIFQYTSFITFHIIKEFVNMQTSHNSTKLVFILCHEFLIFLVKMYSEDIYIINKDLQSFFFKSLKKHQYQDLFNQIKRSFFSYLNFYLHNASF